MSCQGRLQSPAPSTLLLTLLQPHDCQWTGQAHRCLGASAWTFFPRCPGLTYLLTQSVLRAPSAARLPGATPLKRAISTHSLPPLSVFFPRLGAKHHQTRCHQMLVPPTYLPTYHASINLLTVQPLPSLGVTVGLPFTHHSKLDPGRGPSRQSVLSRQQESALLLLAFILIITSPTQRWDA